MYSRGVILTIFFNLIVPLSLWTRSAQILPEHLHPLHHHKTQLECHDCPSYQSSLDHTDLHCTVLSPSCLSCRVYSSYVGRMSADSRQSWDRICIEGHEAGGHFRHGVSYCPVCCQNDHKLGRSICPPPLEQQLKQLLIIFVKISRTDETNAGYWQSLKVVRSLDNLRREFFDWF